MGVDIDISLIVNSVSHVKKNYVEYLKAIFIYYVLAIGITLGLSLLDAYINTKVSMSSACCFSGLYYILTFLISFWFALVLGEFIRRNAKKFTSSITDVMKDMLKGDWLTLLIRYAVGLIVFYIVAGIVIGIPLMVFVNSIIWNIIQDITHAMTAGATYHEMLEGPHTSGVALGIVILATIVFLPMLTTWASMILYRVLDRKKIGEVIKTIKAGFSIPGWVYGLINILYGIIIWIIAIVVVMGLGLAFGMISNGIGTTLGFVIGGLILILLLPFIGAVPLDFMYRVYLKFYKPKPAKANK